MPIDLILLAVTVRDVMIRDVMIRDVIIRDVIIREPMTTLTDYSIALECLLFAALLGWGGWPSRSTPTRLIHHGTTAPTRRQQSDRWGLGFWVIAFGLVAIAAISGGTYHGFALYLPTIVQIKLWRVVLYAISGAGLCMAAATVCTTLPSSIQVGALAAIGGKTGLYWLWANRHPHYGYLIADYLSAMVIVLVLQGWVVWRDRKPDAQWIVAGVVVSGLAVYVQASGLIIPPYFNHNDLYHLVQMIALYLFYRGAVWTQTH